MKEKEKETDKEKEREREREKKRKDTDKDKDRDRERDVKLHASLLAFVFHVSTTEGLELLSHMTTEPAWKTCIADTTGLIVSDNITALALVAL